MEKVRDGHEASTKPKRGRPRLRGGGGGKTDKERERRDTLVEHTEKDPEKRFRRRLRNDGETARAGSRCVIHTWRDGAKFVPNSWSR